VALILLVLIGALAGWFGSIATRTEEKYALRRQFYICLAVSLVVGLVVNGGTVIGSLSWLAAGAAALGCVAALVGNHFYLNRSPEA
jgi:predicted membrane channel-forming protein YqfA (hemolysin III family)